MEPGGSAGDLRVRALDQSFREKLNRRELAWCDSFPARVSRNAAYFFGDQDFWISQMETLLQVAQSSPGQELAAFDRYFGRRPDGEKAMLGGTMSAYFRSIEAVRSVLYGLLESDGRMASAGHYLGTEALLAALRPLTDAMDVRISRTFSSTWPSAFTKAPAWGPISPGRPGAFWRPGRSPASCAGCG